MSLSDAAEPRRNLLAAYRLVVALVIFAALVTEISTLVERGRFVPGNLFSFFTIESNAFAVFVLLISIAWGGSSRAVIMLRGAATLYMAVTGIVFSVLLAGIEGAEFTAVPWDNTVLHFLGPIAAVLDWFLDLPHVRIAYKGALIWLIYPVAYGAYSLIRGALVDWYPYPFLDPAEHGYLSVAITVLGLTLFGAVLTWILVVFTGQKRSTLAPLPARYLRHERTLREFRCDARSVKFMYYVVITDGLSSDDRAEICALVIRALEGTAVQFEADIPWAQATDWPIRVRRAAETLVTATGGTHTDEPYQQTGMMPRVDEAVWQAFATFAGYAYDASVWSENRALPLVSLCDEGTSVVVRLDKAERHHLAAAVHPAQVVPLRKAHEERR